jgi:hypothetical protein
MRGNTALRILLVVLLIILPVAGALYYVSDRDDDRQTLTGAFVLANPDHINKLGRYCTGQRGYGDLQRETPVTLWDAHGNVIATGILSTGVQGEADCRFNFRLENVPDVDEYHLQAAGRPVVIFSKQQLNEATWRVNVVIDG